MPVAVAFCLSEQLKGADKNGRRSLAMPMGYKGTGSYGGAITGLSMAGTSSTLGGLDFGPSNRRMRSLISFQSITSAATGVGKLLSITKSGAHTSQDAHTTSSSGGIAAQHTLGAMPLRVLHQHLSSGGAEFGSHDGARARAISGSAALHGSMLGSMHGGLIGPKLLSRINRSNLGPEGADSRAGSFQGGQASSAQHIPSPRGSQVLYNPLFSTLPAAAEDYSGPPIQPRSSGGPFPLTTSGRMQGLGGAGPGPGSGAGAGAGVGTGERTSNNSDLQPLQGMPALVYVPTTRRSPSQTWLHELATNYRSVSAWAGGVSG